MNTAFTTEQKQEDWLQEFIDEWREEAKEEAKEKGREEGFLEAYQTTIFRLLSKRFGDVSDEIKTQIQELSLAKLEKLSEDLLDFESLEDARKWFLKKSN